MTATERNWLLAAGAAHITLIGALSLAWQHSQRLMPAPTDAVPVELVTIADAPRVTEPPKPSMAAAPQEPAAAPEAQPAGRPSAAATAAATGSPVAHA